MAELSSGITDFTEFLRGFRNKIQPDGTLEDRASPELARIRREIERQKRTIQESLRGYLRRLAEGGAVQDELITIRGERFVIPIKIEQKRRVQGVIHGASSSGQTVFVEPLETIDQNNELVRLLDEELAEIHRILLEMTRRIGENSEPILKAVDVLGELELQFAKARFAEDYNCVPVLMSVKRRGPQEPRGDSRPRLSGPSRARLVLINARHPLLERNLKAKGGHVVPISIELEGERLRTGHYRSKYRRKNRGLENGWPAGPDGAVRHSRSRGPRRVARVRCRAGRYRRLPVHRTESFDVLRPRHQHRLHLAHRDAQTRWCCWTNWARPPIPEEGAALAVAIAEHFRRIGCITVISTHHTSLKVFGANTPGVVNSSVGFDEATLQPTYELKIGVPGASAGINIAQRLGLNPSIIEAARSKLGTQARDVGQFLDSLHANLREAESRTPSPEGPRAGTGARKGEPRRRRTERAAGKDQRDGEKTRNPAAGFRVSGAGDGQRHPGPGRMRKNCRKMPSAAFPNCAGNSASSSIRPWWRIPPGPTRAIRMRNRR